jgi:hypothetical protein
MTESMNPFRRLVVDRSPEETIHFHLGPDGMPAVCDRAHCDSPSISEIKVSRRNTQSVRQGRARRRRRRV